MKRCLLLALALLLVACSFPVQEEQGNSARPEVTRAAEQEQDAEDARDADDADQLEEPQETPNDSLPPDETEPTASPPQPQATASPAPVVGGRVTELIPLYPRTLNPLFVENEAQSRVMSLLFEGLMEISSETGLPVPALAEEVQASPDGLRYTFTLRSGAKWHDGAPLAARDVVWTYDILRRPELEAPLLPYAQRIENVTASGPSTVVFTLTEPYSPFLARLATVPLIPRKPFAGLSGARLQAGLLNWRAPVGTGPFRWKGASPERSIELEAHQQYHGGEPLLDNYSFRVVQDVAATQQALAAGEADMAWLPPSLTRELAEQDFLGQAPVHTPTSTLLLFNLDPARGGPRVADKRVRQAIAHALDLEKLSTSLGGAITPAAGFLPRTVPTYIEHDARPFAYDPGRASTLLNQAGWRDINGDGIREKGGRELTIGLAANQVPATFPATLGTSYGPALARITADWKAVGIRAQIRPEGWELLATRLFSTHAFEAALLSVSGDADPDTSYLWSTGAYAQGFNAGRYTSKAVDGLLAEGIRLQTPEERGEIYGMLHRQLVADVPAVPLGTTQMIVVSNTRLVGAPTDYWSALQHSNVERWYVQDGL